MDGKIEHVCIKLCVKLGKSTPETLEMLHEAFKKRSLSQTVVLNGIHVSSLFKCQLRMTNVQGNQARAE
jgi:hypothetical protein